DPSFFSSRRRHTRFSRDWSSDVCSSDLLTAAFTGTHFVFVGPTSPHPELQSVIGALAARPNVHFLGGKHVDELPAYVRRFDIGKIGRASCRVTGQMPAIGQADRGARRAG